MDALVNARHEHRPTWKWVGEDDEPEQPPNSYAIHLADQTASWTLWRAGVANSLLGQRQSSQQRFTERHLLGILSCGHVLHDGKHRLVGHQRDAADVKRVRLRTIRKLVVVVVRGIGAGRRGAAFLRRAAVVDS